MAFLGAEAVLDQAEAALQAGLPDAITAVNAAYADGVTITAPLAADYRRVFDPADQKELDTYSYPLVVMRPEPESAGGPTLEDEYEVATPFEVSIVVGYDEAGVQQKQLLRYMRAVKTVLAPQTSLDCGSVAYAGGGFARTWTTDSGIVRDVSMVFVVTMHETP